MKKIIYLASLILCVLLLLPLTAMNKAPSVSESDTKQSEKTTSVSKSEKIKEDCFCVYNPQTGKTSEIPCDDYIIGVVCGEMPALYEPEALKAQAVAAYSYTLYRKAENAAKEYDITTDYTTDQNYVTKEDADKKWGDKADEYYKKIKSAVESVKGYAVTYKGKPALCVYHAISSGKTESCLDIWGKDIEYLREVDSPGDKLSPDFITTLTVSTDDFKSKLESDCSLSGDAKTWCGKYQRTDSGTVTEMAIGDKKIKGSRIRDIFNLRSANFSIEYSDGSFNFKICGYGHGVGMSQYGANCYAKDGSDFKKILTHYYSGCKIEKNFK